MTSKSCETFRRV